MNRSVPVLIGLAVIAVLAAVAFLQVSSGPPAAPPPPPVPVPSTVEAAPPPATAPAAPAPRKPRAAPNPPMGGSQAAASTGENKDETPPPPPTEEELEAAFPADAEGVKQAMADMRPMLAQCYSDALADVPDLAPRLDIRMTISNRHGLGRARAVRIMNDDVDDPDLQDCMAAAMEGLAFKPPGKALSITFPMAFRAP